ncbi:fused MFS/spermidine synthase [Umezawaea sp. Da 62-37]|uniref:spermidine synthase n=1 Tax=Umezawaea sp. Da 62-37 TaxID=3075927 RepID=UPI0028F734DA|nr:fused MFS/spermidine synthase [Umezawaea sp. Da 62-37]WNV89277.1 fused MFS/spermidine synthase [Umezawaea sp. Da 62-37]
MARGRNTPQTLSEQVDSGTAELSPDPDRPNAWLLRLNGTAQSHVDLDDPTHLEFEYVQRLAHLVDLLAPTGKPVRALHLGGGGFTLPRYIAATRPRSTQQVVEIDGALIELLRRALPPEKNARIRMRNGDAREVMSRAPDETFDLVVSDVFSGARTPAHLTSVEYVREAARTMVASGVYASNIGDGNALVYARAQAATVRAVFEHVAVIAEPGILRGRRFGNLVILGSRVELPLEQLVRRTAGDPFPGRVEHGGSLVKFIGGAKATTDATATRSPSPPPGTWGLPAE